MAEWTRRAWARAGHGPWLALLVIVAGIGIWMILSSQQHDGPGFEDLSHHASRDGDGSQTPDIPKEELPQRVAHEWSQARAAPAAEQEAQSIRGVVRTGEGEVVPGAEVRLTPTAKYASSRDEQLRIEALARRPARVLSDESGHFSFPTQFASMHEVQAFSGDRYSLPTPARPGDYVELELRRGAACVFEVRTESGTAVADAKVIVRDVALNRTVARFVTDDDGRTPAAAAPREGAVDCIVVHPEFEAFRRRVDTSELRAPVVPLVLPAAPCVLIGRLLGRTTGQPVAGATVKDLGNLHKETITDVAGRFRLEAYRIGSESRLYLSPQEQFGPVVQRVKVEELVTEVTLYADTGWAIRIEVVRPDGQPVPGALVIVQGQFGRGPTNATEFQQGTYLQHQVGHKRVGRTDENGRLTIEGLSTRGNNYRVTVEKPGYATRVRTLVGQDVRVTLVPGYRVLARVVRQDNGKPYWKEGLRLILEPIESRRAAGPGDAYYTTIVGRGGMASFDGVLPGSYRVVMRGMGHGYLSTGTITVRAAQSIDVKVPNERVRVVVRDSEGTPLPDIVVDIRVPGDKRMLALAVTDEKGECELVAEARAYELVAWHKARPRSTVELWGVAPREVPYDVAYTE